MARLDPYVTVQEYRARIGKDTSFDDTALETDLLAVSRYIDRETGHRAGFGVDTANVARIYGHLAGTPSARYYAVLDIDDLVSVSTVEEYIGTAWTATTAYALLPRNAAVENEPYRQLEKNSGVWESLVRVTGKWGWPVIPAAIKAATIELTSILRLESPRATNRITEIGAVLGTSRPAQAIIEGLVSDYLNPAVFP